MTDFSLDFLVLFLKERTKESAKSWVGLIDVLGKSFLQVGTRKYTKVGTLTRAISCNEIETKTLSLHRDIFSLMIASLLVIVSCFAYAYNKCHS